MISTNTITQEELEAWHVKKTQQATLYNRIGLWIALVLYPIWSVLDVLIAPEELFSSFMYTRFVCGAVMLVFALAHLKFKFNPIWLAYPVVLTIGTDIAYMCNQVSSDLIMPYMMQYCTLFVCSGMLHIWSIRHSIIVVAITLFMMIFFKETSLTHTYGDLLSNGGLIVTTVLIVYVFLIATRTNLMKKAFLANFNLEKALKVVNDKNEIIVKKNEQISDSINYGLRIQQAILPSKTDLESFLGEHLLFYKPRNVVSGDFYWHAEKDNRRYFAVGDCTGHGVPGAFMSIIGASILNQTLHETASIKPEEIIGTLRFKLMKLLKQDSSTNSDGMEIGLLCFDCDEEKITFAGSRINLYQVKSNGDIIEHTADKQPIGGYGYKNFKGYTSQKITPEIDDVLFLTSDGLQDQYSADNKKFGKKRLRDLFCSLAKNNPIAAKDLLENNYSDWKGDSPQIDDIIVAGIWLNKVITFKEEVAA